MKRFAVTGMVVVLGFLGAACTGNSTPEPTTPAPAVTTTAPVVPDSSPATLVRQVLRDEYSVSVESNAAADEIGETICGEIDRNGATVGTFLDIVKAVEKTFFPGDETLAAQVTGVYIGAYCPEYVDDVQAIANA